MVKIRGGFKGGGGRTLLLRDSTPCRPRGSTLSYFLRHPFLVTDTKIFLKAPLAPMYTNFEKERAPKKNAIFLSKFSKKCPKTGINLVHLKKILPPRENPRSAAGQNILRARSKQKSTLFKNQPFVQIFRRKFFETKSS